MSTYSFNRTWIALAKLRTLTPPTLSRVTTTHDAYTYNPLLALERLEDGRALLRAGGVYLVARAADSLQTFKLLQVIVRGSCFVVL